MRKRYILFSGFTLFSLFFGAGNLIFPPSIGMESGNFFIPAIAGFILTSVFLPFLAIISGALSNDGLLSMAQRVNPVFGLIFASVVYLSIGPFYAIPRAASVAYELGYSQVLNVEGQLPLLIFSVIFFGITYLLSVNPTKIIDYVGQFLTPALLIVLAILVVKAFLTYTYADALPAEKFQSSPFLTGFFEGYFTMDAIAALAFGIVIINGLKSKGATNKKELMRGTILTGLIAAIGLAAVYISLSWIGRVMPHEDPIANGAEILVLASQQLFGFGGSVLFGIIVTLACLTTCVGLINACGTFFHEVFPKISYKGYALLFIVIGMLITNLGLNQILSVAAPLLTFIYPIAIVLIVLTLFQHFFGGSKKMYIYAIAVATVFAFYSALSSFNIQIDQLNSILSVLPLYENGLAWTLPALLAAAIGYTMDRKETVNQ
ncbi:branched-chain amino acid transport system II carrier protein [Virgibacillus kekensis]|uniref:Branched-chain amino acid transport system carrier protein n=1 Tax=Virgibacillus kekensis TaxID=202261 RepID=A0ABV9DIF0_9BACI